jgi:hypothetical protein
MLHYRATGSRYQGYPRRRMLAAAIGAGGLVRGEGDGLPPGKHRCQHRRNGPA